MEPVELDYQLLVESIEALKLPPRLINCLRDGGVSTISDLINKKYVDLLRFQNMGKKSLDMITKALEDRELRFGMHFVIVNKPEIKNENFDLTIEGFREGNKKDLSLQELSVMLMSKTDDFLLGLNKKNRLIFMARFGFNEDEQTLEEIAKQVGVTRERVRQIQVRLGDKLISCLPLSSEAILEILQNNIMVDFCEGMSELFTCFDSAKSFYEYLEMVTGIGAGTILEKQLPDIKTTSGLVGEYFYLHESPANKSELTQYMEECFGFSEVVSAKAIRILVKEGKLREMQDGYYPARLGRIEAVSHILIGHINGLPWKDICHICNHNKFSKSPLPDDRFTLERDGEYYYSSARGILRHINYLDLSNINIDVILCDLRKLLEQAPEQSGMLLPFYNASESHVRQINYYTLRYIVRKYGSDYGVYFYGKSGADRVSLTGNFEGVNQKASILKLIENTDGGLTINDVAMHIKSKSEQHARLYLSELIKEKKVVQIDRMMYTTSARAFSGVKITKISEFSDDLLRRNRHVVFDIKYFAHLINVGLDLSYPFQFYKALLNSAELLNNYHMSANLISFDPLSFQNISDVVRAVCKKNLADNVNIVALKNILLARESTLQTALYNWRKENADGELVK